MKKGITLTSLVITVILLIILAGVGIGTLGPDGIIAKAEEAKEQAQIDDEKEIIGTSVVQAVGVNRYGNIEKEELEIYLERNSDDRDIEVFEDGDMLVVNFKDTNRYYEIDDEGDISDPIVKEEIEYAGDITKGGRCDGSEEKPFEINCIEDLVAFSIMTNGGNTQLGLASNTFPNKYVILVRTLDFNSIFSYNDPTTMLYGDLNTDGTIENIKTELTKTAEGCVGFTPVSSFGGYFNGQGNEIQNIYINREERAALLVEPSGQVKKLKNLGVTGEITSTTERAAGILVGGLSATIENCWNKANVTGGLYDVAGISTGSLLIRNCYNTGNITNTATQNFGYGMTGGITTSFSNTVNTVKTVENCYNTGDIKGAGYVGGIASGHGNGKTTIKNCYNTGNIQGKSATGGILGTTGATIENCYNTGEVTGNEYAGGIVGDGATEIKNCYNTGKVTGSGATGQRRYLRDFRWKSDK